MVSRLSRLALTTPSGLLSMIYTYFLYSPANGAPSSAICAAVYSLPGSKPDGVSVLAFFLTAGFCFWGITVLNIWFCFAGTLVFCFVRKVNPCTQGNVFLFSTGIAPLMTDLLIRYPGADAHGVTLFGAVAAFLACCLIGLVLPAGLAHAPKMHKGYDLYNAAVPIGLVAFFLRAVCLLYTSDAADE